MCPRSFWGEDRPFRSQSYEPPGGRSYGWGLWCKEWNTQNVAGVVLRRGDFHVHWREDRALRHKGCVQPFSLSSSKNGLKASKARLPDPRFHLWPRLRSHDLGPVEDRSFRRVVEHHGSPSRAILAMPRHFSGGSLPTTGSRDRVRSMQVDVTSGLRFAPGPTHLYPDGLSRLERNEKDQGVPGVMPANELHQDIHQSIKQINLQCSDDGNVRSATQLEHCRICQ